MVKVGDKICADIAGGTSSVTEADGLRSVNRTLTLVQGNYAVNMALMDLCPALIHQDGSPLLPTS